MRVRYTARALHHLNDIYDYIAHDNPTAATSVIGRIRATAQSLQHFPYLGHVGTVPGTLERSVVGLPYIVVYQVNVGDTDEVLILGVFHGRQERG